MRNLDEEIKYCEELAELNKDCARIYGESEPVLAGSCLEAAKEHRQLAEWLRKLNDIEHLFSVTEKLFKANFRGGVIDVVDGYDILFSEHNQLRGIFEEVNADEDSD